MSTITTGKVIIYKPNFNVNPVDTLLDLPVLGAENTLYVIKDTGAIYLWDGSEFIIYDSRPYKVYTALLTQTGTDAPVATVLENTLGGEVVWTYGSTGVYIGTLAGVFTSNKTIVFISSKISSITDPSSGILMAESSTVNTVNINSYGYDAGVILTDNLVANIEIRVYP